jgi:ankyrin repeat protein
LKFLLADSRIDPTTKHQHPIGLASEWGQAEVVKLLLADPRVDPSAEDQFAFRRACESGQTEVVKLLLADKRVDPSVDDQYPIRYACGNGQAEVVKLLLADPRVDPTAKDQFVIRSAIKYHKGEVLKVLLADQRVLPPSLSNYSSCSPVTIALLLLRQSPRHEIRQLYIKNTNKFDCASVLAEIEKIESQRKALLDAHLLVSDLSALCLEYVPDLFCHLSSSIYTLIDTTRYNKNNFPRFSFADLSSL